MANWDSYYSVKASVAAFGGAAAGLSNPSLYWLFLLSLPIAAITYFTLNLTSSKRIFLVGFVAVSIYGFMIGRHFHDGKQLTNTGFFAILLSLLAGIVLTMFLHGNETEARDGRK